MNKLFPLPFYTFLKIVFQNGGIDILKIKNAVPWFTKTLLFEPLRWIELATYNQQVKKHEFLKHPIFILGYYRSGTSYLHECLIQDNRLGYHTNYQMVLPEVMLTTEKTLLPVFDLVCRVFKIKDSVHRVPLSFKFPGEEDAAMTTYVDEKGAHWGYFFPKTMRQHFQKYVLFDNISASELKEWMQSFIFLLKKISIANKQKQLVLKSPPNTARIKQLLALFPQAKFIFIHRNPYDVYSSNKKFWQVIQKVYALQKTKSVDVNTLILDTYALMMNRYFRERDLIPLGQLSELAYDEFINNPVDSLKKIYCELHLDHFNYCEEKMKLFTGRQKRFVQLMHELNKAETKMVSEKLELFIRRWDYKLL